MTWRAIGTFAVALLPVACALAPAPVVRFADAHVEIRTWVDVAGDGSATLGVEFVPTEDGVHLYGMELPDGGIDGAGRPTRVAVVDPDWELSAPATASIASMRKVIDGFETPFAVYPDGPVTVLTPLRLRPSTAVDKDSVIEVRVTFMACTSTGLCYVPVEGAAITVPIG